MQGSIMDSITSGFDTIKKPVGPRSQAISTGSMLSQMKVGTFFKMVDSPFKASLMVAYDRL